jgi:hypothetical protein
VFDRYFIVISKTFAAIYQEGLGVVAGPRIAARMLKKVATDLGVWSGPDGVLNGLMEEIRRLTNVVVGGETVPLAEAVTRGILNEDEADEVEGAIVFFTVASLMHKTTDLPGVLAGMSALWDAVSTPLGPMEYVRSLPTSSETAPTGERATASSTT